MGEILTRLLLLMPAFSLPSAPPSLATELHSRTERSPTPSTLGRRATASVVGLSPVTFSAQDGIDQ